MVKYGIMPDHFTISTLCRGIKGPDSKKAFERVLTLFYAHRVTLETRTTVMYNCLIECCVLTKNMDLALKLFEEFKEENNEKEKPDLVSYNILLKGYSYTRNLNAALKLVEEMKLNQL
jgi:pentatricopeptide repeat protein